MVGVPVAAPGLGIWFHFTGLNEAAQFGGADGHDALAGLLIVGMVNRAKSGSAAPGLVSAPAGALVEQG